MPTLDHVPVIDIERLEDDPAVAKTLEDACRHWGFFQVINHAIPDELTSSLQEEMAAFFALPTAVKRSIERTADNPWGYFDRELTKNRPDWKQIFDVGPDALPDEPTAARAQWPSQLPRFQPTVDRYYAACERLSFRLLAAVVRSLGMPGESLHDSFAPRHSSFLRLNYYPRCPELSDGGDRESHFGVHEHTDSGALTILLQDDQAGLQVLRDDRWYLVEPRRGALVINIGDIVQVWSNDRYRAAVHRVLANPDADRYSVPFFFNPAPSVSYAPLPTTCTPERPARYRPINWGEFRAGRAAGDYADLGEEIQIGQFRSV